MFYLAHSGYHALPHTKHATNSTTKGTPYRVPSGQDPWVWPDNPAYPPWPHLRYPLTSKDEDPNNKKLLGRVAHERRGQYCFISLTQHTMHHFTQNTPPNPTTEGTPYRVPSGQDPWVLPAKPDIPPTAAPPEASYRRPEENIVLSALQ